MKHITNRLILPALAVTTASVLTATTADAALFFYEDFSGFSSSNTGVSLNGQGGWSSPGSSFNVHNGTIGQDGGSGTWNGTIPGSPTSGGNFIAPVFGGTQGFGNISLAPFVTNSFAAGTTTWLSYVEFNANGGANGRQNLAIGAAQLTALDGLSMAGDGIGVASTVNNTPRAAYWDGTGENADAGSGIGSGRPIFVVAKIDWNDVGNDTITVKRFAFNVPGGLDEAAWDAEGALSTISADLDQSTFDTLSIASGFAWFDDIRIANDFDSAITGSAVTVPTVIPEPGSLALLALGGLCCLARRQR